MLFLGSKPSVYTWPMRIAIINRTGGGMSGGYRAYLGNVLPRLVNHPAVEAVLCAAPAALQMETWFPPLPKVLFVPCQPFRFLHHRPDNALKQSVTQFAPDVIFIPVEKYLRFPGIPLVLMLQHMGPLAPVAGNPLSERLRYVAQRHETRIAMRHADRVIVPTNFVREFLTDTRHIPREKVTTIYYGASVPSESLTSQKPAAVPKEWAEKFLFTAGSIEPYRGLEDILEAMYHIRTDHRIGGLIIAGTTRKNMMLYRERLKSLIVRYGLVEKIQWVNFLSEEEMVWCYQNCCAFIMTSRVESFGITGMEALAHGCVSIFANNPPFPEIFSNVGYYYAPGDGEDCARSLRIILDLDPAERRAIVDRAKRRATEFSWDHTVESTVRLFAEVLR